MTPTPGTQVEVAPEHFTTLNSTRPVVRVLLQNNKWVAADPADRRGYITFVDDKEKALQNKRITFTTTHSTHGFAQ